MNGMQLDPRMLAQLLQQAQTYRQNPGQSTGIDPAMMPSGGAGAAMGPPQQMAAPQGPPGMPSGGPPVQPATMTPSPQSFQGSQQGVDLTGLLQQAQQYRSRNQNARMGPGGFFINPMSASQPNNAQSAQQGMADALRRSAMGEY